MILKKGPSELAAVSDFIRFLAEEYQLGDINLIEKAYDVFEEKYADWPEWPEPEEVGAE